VPPVTDIPPVLDRIISVGVTPCAVTAVNIAVAPVRFFAVIVTLISCVVPRGIVTAKVILAPLFGS